MPYKKVDFDKRTLRRKLVYDCPICGNKFKVDNKKQWVYKIYFMKDYRYMCSYKCMTDFINKYK